MRAATFFVETLDAPVVTLGVKSPLLLFEAASPIFPRRSLQSLQQCMGNQLHHVVR